MGRFTVGKRHDPVQNTNGHRFICRPDKDLMPLDCLIGFQTGAAFAVTVTVIFTLLRVKLNSPCKNLLPMAVDR